MKTKIKKILLVEDNPGDIQLAQLALEEFAPDEFAMRQEGCVQNAMERLSKERFDIILLDLFLPDASGLQALSRIHVIHPYIPIIALTGFMDEKTALHAERLGANFYFCKDNLSWERVFQTARHLVDRRSDGSLELSGKI